MKTFPLFQYRADKIPPRLLINEDLSRFSKDVALDHSLNIWLCNRSGPQNVLGGIYGAQKINTSKINKNTSAQIMGSLEYINHLTGLKIQTVYKKNDADIRIYLDQKIDLGLGAQYVGLTVLNEEESNWEIFISRKKIKNENHKIYTILHEIGHTLGLEHPHDDQDNDFYLSTTVKYSAAPHQTIMSYREPANNKAFPNKYTANDLKAMETIWGSSPHSKKLAIDKLVQKPIRPKILGSKKLRFPVKATSDIIINGKGAPDSELNVYFQNKFYQTANSNTDGTWMITFDKKFLNKQNKSLGSHLKIEQIDSFGNVINANPIFVDLI